MDINKAYNICICVIVTVFFFGSFFLGNMLHAKEEPVELPEKETTFTVSRLRSDEPEPDRVEKLTEPQEDRVTADTEKCDYTVSPYYYNIALDNDRQDYVFKLCSEYDLPCELVFAVMGVESSYEDSRISNNGDYGIMQINSINHGWLSEELGVEDFLDYEQNVLCGVYMLADYYHRYVDFNKIAMCYRYGENAAMEMWENGITETDYTRQIVRRMAMMEYRKQFTRG